MEKLRLKFWYWAHDAAESLWHWIYYNKLPNGKEQARQVIDGVNHAYSYTWHFVNSKGDKVEPPK